MRLLKLNDTEDEITDFDNENELEEIILLGRNGAVRRILLMDSDGEPPKYIG